jgi:excisionase family DNA binding protein
VTSDLRAALKVLALANPPGTPVNLTLVREDLLELVDGNGARHETPAGPDRLMTVADAARRCALSPRYIYAHADRLPFIKRTGRKVLVSEARLARWIERRPGQAGGR